MSNLLALIEKQKPAIEKALPRHINADRMTRVALTAVKMNHKLQMCTPESFLGSLMLCSQLGLEPNTPLGHAYIIPYGKDATFVLGYKGLLDLAYRTGNYKTINCTTVYEKDQFEYTLGMHPKIDVHKPPKSGDRGAVVGYYAYYILKSGGEAFSYWTRDECEAHGKKYSKSFHKGPWRDNFDQMARKTVLKDVLRYAPLSPEHRELFANTEADNAVVTLDAETGELLTVHGNSKQIEAENMEVEVKVKDQNDAIDALEG